MDGAGSCLIGDEWAWIFDSFHVNAGTILQDYNGHLMATTYGLYDVLTRAGLGRGSLEDLYASRYVYQGAVIAMLILVEAASAFGIRRRTASLLVTFGVVVSVALNLGWRNVWADHLRGQSAMARARPAALEIARDSAPPLFRSTDDFALGAVTARDYFKATGSSAARPRIRPRN